MLRLTLTEVVAEKGSETGAETVAETVAEPYRCNYVARHQLTSWLIPANLVFPGYSE